MQLEIQTTLNELPMGKLDLESLLLRRRRVDILVAGMHKPWPRRDLTALVRVSERKARISITFFSIRGFFRVQVGLKQIVFTSVGGQGPIHHARRIVAARNVKLEFGNVVCQYLTCIR